MDRFCSYSALLALLLTGACSSEPAEEVSGNAPGVTPPTPGDNLGGAGGTNPGPSGGAGGSATPSTAGAGGNTPPSTGGETSPPGAPPAAGGSECPTEVLVNEANNYTFSSQLDLSIVSVKPDTNLTFDWSGLTRDFMGHDVDPLADVDLVLAALWGLTPEELTERMNNDSLSQADVVAPAMFYTDNVITSAELFDAQLFENPLTPEELLPRFSVEQYDPEQYTYSLMARTGELLIGTGTRMIQLFKLDPNSEETTVYLTNESTKLSYQVDLQRAQPTQIPSGSAAITVDWGENTAGLANNALGNEFVASRVSEVLVAHYDESLAELEEQFLDLQLIAESEWRHTLEAGSSVTLDQLTDEAGQPFGGIDGSGTWVLGLICGDCSNPAPWYLTPLQTCPAQ